MIIRVIAASTQLEKIIDKEQLSYLLIEKAKEIFMTNTQSSIECQFISGSNRNALPGTIISVLLSSVPNEKNTGIMLAMYKRALIDIFSKSGLSISKDTLQCIISDELNYSVESNQTPTSLVSSQAKPIDTSANSEFDYSRKAKMFTPVVPAYSFDRVILPEAVIDKLNDAIGILECEQLVFEEWGLYEIQPHPSTALSFFGPSGTGKTMAAEAIANKLGKKILKVSYADVESKYHGEGPKMVRAIFLAAQKEDAVLFFDEADSLLSKRLTNVTQGSEQAINSMRSQLLVCLEEYRGIVIFATNLVINYDTAFLTRLISIEFPIPDEETRKKIWDVHIRPVDSSKPHKLNIPLADDVDTSDLAHKYNFVGREIRNSVISACIHVAQSGRRTVCQSDFVNACERLIAEKASLESQKPEEAIKKAILSKLRKETSTSSDS